MQKLPNRFSQMSMKRLLTGHRRIR